MSYAVFICSPVAVPIVQHEYIFEKNISEHLRLADMQQRTQHFTEWLLSRPEKCIVVVGHSAFFRDLIRTDCKMDNCEIRSVLLSEHGEFHSSQTLVEGEQNLLKPSQTF